MITNEKNATLFFILYPIFWVLQIFFIIISFMLFKQINLIVIFILLCFLAYSILFLHINIISIDISGLGITYISKSLLGGALLDKRIEIDYNEIKKISFRKGFIKSICLQNRKNQEIYLPLTFFDRKKIKKLQIGIYTNITNYESHNN